MKVLFYSFFKILFFAIICYSIGVIAALPFIAIPESFYPNVLSSILIKESLFLIAGFIIIVFSKCFFIYSNINFRLSKTIIYYLSTLFVILIFCYILYLLNVIDVNLIKITSLYSFGKFLIYCTIPTFFIGFGEEVIFRWFLLNRLKTFLNTTTAIIVSSLIFCLGHNWNLPNMLFAFTGGCLFALIYIRTDSVFYCISIHSAWNFGQRFFFNGMSEFPYKAQRLILFDIKNIELYNWVESFLGVLMLTIFVIFYMLKDKKIHEINIKYNVPNSST